MPIPILGRGVRRNRLTAVPNAPIIAGQSLFLAWNYSVTTGGVTTNAQGLGVDDVLITAQIPDGAAVPVPLAAFGGMALFPLVMLGKVRRRRRS